MPVLFKNTIILLLVLFLGTDLNAQTCCTAGAPVGSYLGIQPASGKTLSLQLNYEYNSINLLVDQNNRIENDPRSRYGQSLSAKIDYAFNNKWAVSTILPFVHQARITRTESESSLGLGDLFFLVQYNLINNTFTTLSASGGIKLPIGKTNHKGNAGIFLSPDMQSGTGSVDYIVRTSFSRSNFLTPFSTGYFNSAFRFNGANEDFGSTPTFTGRNFAFGNESNSQLGLRYLFTTKHGFLSPDLGLKFRWADNNLEQNNDAPNSGGYWISLPLGFSFAPDENKSIALSAEFPIYQNLSGLQISTNFKLGFQVNYTFKNDKINSTLK